MPAVRLAPLQLVEADTEHAGTGLAVLYSPSEGFAVGLSGTYNWVSQRKAQPTDGMPQREEQLWSPVLSQWVAMVIAHNLGSGRVA